MFLLVTYGEVKKKSIDATSTTNKGAIPSWSSKNGGCKVKEEFGEVIKFYSPKSGLLR